MERILAGRRYVQQPPCTDYSLPRGRLLHRTSSFDPTAEFLLYVPTRLQAGARILATLHGISRNATEHCAAFAPMAETCGIVLLAPIFTAERSPDYQRLGLRNPHQRSDLILKRMAANVAQLTGADASQLDLVGFSGGAQMAHRFAMAHPHRVRRAVLVAAGWYTFPDPIQRYPYGIRPAREVPDLAFDPEQFLRVPFDVLVGAEDTSLEAVRSTARIVAQQGRTRLDRARRWVAAMRDAGVRWQTQARITLDIVPGVGHSFAQFCQDGGLVERVAERLFERRAPVGRTRLRGVMKTRQRDSRTC